MGVLSHTLILQKALRSSVKQLALAAALRDEKYLAAGLFLLRAQIAVGKRSCSRPAA